jgi:hypothetical protein
LREVHGGGQLSDESSRFWELLAPSLRAAATDQVLKQITTDEQVDEARRRLHEGLSDVFSIEAVGFIIALHSRLKHFGSIEKFDVEGIDGYGTKLEALMDPDARYDRLRQAFMQPGRDAEATVADEIYSLNETRRDGVAFETLAHRLLELDAIAKTRTEDPPYNFVNEAFETYLRTLTTDGHSYYLAYDEVLAVAQAVRTNVVVPPRLPWGRGSTCDARPAAWPLRAYLQGARAANS